MGVIFLFKNNMNFFKHLYNSSWNFTWLNEIKDKKGRSWGYFFLFIFLLSVFILIPYFWKGPAILDELSVTIEENLPVFTAEFEDGELSVRDLDQPFILSNLEEDSDEMFQTEINEFLLYIDTETTSTLDFKEIMEQKNATNGVLVTRTYVEIYEEDGSSESQDFSDMDDVSFTNEDVSTVIDKIKGPLMYIGSVLAVVLVFIGLIIGKLIYLLIYSLMIFAISAVAKKGWSFDEIYTLGLSAVILPSVAKLILGYFGVKLPFVYTVIFLILVIGTIFTQNHASSKGVEEVRPEEI